MSKYSSIQLIVPNKKCMNNCKFCCVNMTGNVVREVNHKLLLSTLKTLSTESDTLVITGNSEPIQNKKYLSEIGDLLDDLPTTFKQIDFQTTGVLLNDDNLDFLRKVVGVTRINLSLSSFSGSVNKSYCGINSKLIEPIPDVCKRIIKHGFKLRLSLLLTDSFDNISFKEIDSHSRYLGADQVVFKVLQVGEVNETYDWIMEHKMQSSYTNDLFKKMSDYIKLLAYLFDGNISYKWDEDCLNSESAHYLILREDGLAFDNWEDAGKQASKIENVIKSVNATLEVEGLEPSYYATQQGIKMLNKQISGNKARSNILKYHGIKVK